MEVLLILAICTLSRKKWYDLSKSQVQSLDKPMVRWSETLNLRSSRIAICIRSCTQYIPLCPKTLMGCARGHLGLVFVE